jgi:methylated-DNA-[protein]-cysteine S-methyltransferase
MKRQPTPFEERVYALVRTIPRGKVSTYGFVAKKLGCGSSQAIGQALRRNPYAPEMPCHRVVSSALTLGGFNGEREGDELRRKREMLEEEGVQFDQDGKVAQPSVFAFDAK